MLDLVEDLNNATKSLEEIESKLDSINNRSSIRSNADKVGQQFTLIFCSLTDNQLEALMLARQLSFAMSDDFTKFLQSNFKTKVVATVDEYPVVISKQPEVTTEAFQNTEKTQKRGRSKLIRHLTTKWDFSNEVVSLDQIAQYLYESSYYRDCTLETVKRKAYHALYAASKKAGLIFKNKKLWMEKGSV